MTDQWEDDVPLSELEPVELSENDVPLFEDVADDGTLIRVDQPALIADVEAGTLFDAKDALGMKKQEWEGQSGALLEAVDCEVGPPKHQVHKGEVWRLSGRHVLVVADVIKGWMRWVPYLTGASDPTKTLFVPYPEPYLTLTDIAETRTLIMVQCDTYLAGHVLDKHAAAFGEDSLKVEVSSVW